MLASQQVADADFPLVKWREGYEIDEVRALLDRIRVALERYEGRGTISDLTARDVEQTRFQATKFRAGGTGTWSTRYWMRRSRRSRRASRSADRGA